MSLVYAPGQATDPRGQQSPGLTSNLPSNNPFRNRATSPSSSLPSPVTTAFNNIPTTAPERPISRNPFLDQSEKKDSTTVQVRSASPDKGSSTMAGRVSPPRPVLTGHAVELFDNLAINNNTLLSKSPQGMPPPYTDRPLRSENLPPRTRNGIPGHHISRSQEEDMKEARSGGRPRRPEVDIFADPASPEGARNRPRMRRNSDSSINSKMPGAEDERRRRDRYRRDREARHRGDSKTRPPTSNKPKKPNKQIDLIDSLDVTSIYGSGLFHHDGPFDACNPHRNRKGSQRAPMQAFAKDSANNTIGGSGPINKDLNHAQIHGHGAEGFTDYSTAGVPNPAANETIQFEPYAGSSVPTRLGPGVRVGLDRTSSFNPIARADKIHGEETMGLGTTTHLEGAPAPRAAIQRRESENEQVPGAGIGGGLGRKRSLAQKIRGISNSNRGPGPGPLGRVTTPDGIHERIISPLRPGEALSAGGNSKVHESNPFFNDYDDAYERKGQRIQAVEQRNRNGSIGGGEDQVNARARAMSSPKRAVAGGLLERRVTNDGTSSGPGDGNGSGGGSTGGGGFLNRVKSLRGGRRARPERRE